MEPRMNRFFCTLSALFLLSSSIWAENWPGWRGPSSNGQSSEKNLPTTWSDKQNIKWKIPLPEQGNASPIVWGHRLFLAQPIGKKRSLWCVDRKDGTILWQRDVLYEEKEPTHG